MTVFDVIGKLAHRMESRMSSKDGYELMMVADMMARKNVSDEEAKRALAERIPASVRSRRYALIRLSKYRDSFEFDRAYRLLEAALLETVVEPIDDVRADLFQREADLGWMPLGDAFRCIVNLVPEIADIAHRLEESLTDAAAVKEMPEQRVATTLHVARLLGPKANHSDRLVRSYLSRNTVLRYFKYIQDGKRTERDTVSYFGS